MKGVVDRAIRVVLGVALLIVGFAVVGGTAGTIMGVIGFVPLLTGLVGWCLLCSSLEQTGCVIAYTSFNKSSPASAGGFASAPEGTQAACVNPAELAHGDSTF